ncbi:MAG TPA: response regulator transcription factor [Saprospiraceae bacterium]|nr:response regulator transcription factor [Saprospiraceae bacterium]
MMYKVFIIDDHSLFCQALEVLINRFENYEVDYIGRNGRELIHRLQDPAFAMPDIILLDVKMPVMDGIETMDWLMQKHPDIPVIALSMEDEDLTVIQMLRKGVKGYLLKDVKPEILKKALDDTLTFGFYQSEKVSKALMKNLRSEQIKNQLKEKELEFIRLSCSELTYKEIATIMNLSPKTIDGYRESLFEKLDVKSRVGLVMFALKNKLIVVE